MESEKHLAKKLKSDYCYNGVEADPKESATILHKLGLLYQEKSPNKVCLLQSAALLTSALVRKPDDVKDIEKDLNKLCLHILTLAEAENPDTALVDVAVKEAKQQIKILRETTSKNLKTLGPMPDSLKGQILKIFRKIRSKYIRRLQEDITNQYKYIMNCIASHVVSILGKPLCKFSVVGMGSLAREEITPYSDFEHVIILEEGIQNVQNYSKILEYFRWFATVLQLIIIRLGETVLSFLCIPCLNHPLEEENNWFYDKFTPCGIRPDGFAPHASKNPLGRQTETPDKPWINELIKPVSEMVKYLDTEEGLKEGYLLADMLTKTCLVYGDVIIFEQFKMRVKQSHKQNPFGVSNVEQIKKDLQQFKICNSRNGYKFDVKRFFYRGSSLFVHALGKLHGCEQNNGFALIDEMFHRQRITDDDYEKLQFCLAVACEARLRIYNTASSQNDVHYLSIFKPITFPSFVKDLANDVGSRALVDCLSISLCLHEHVGRCITSETVSVFSAVESHKYKFIFTMLLHLSGFPHQLGKKGHDSPNQIFDGDHLVELDDSCQYVEYLKLVYLLLRLARNCKMIKAKPFSFFMYVYDAVCMAVIGKLKTAVKYLRKANKIMHFYPHIVDEKYKADVFSILGICFVQQRRLQKASNYFDVAYKIRMSPDDSLFYFWCLLRLSKFDKAKLVAEDLIIQRKSLHVNVDVDIHTINAHIILSVCCQERGYFNNLPILNKMYNHSDILAFLSFLQDCNLDKTFEACLKTQDKVVKCMKQADKHQEQNNWDITLCHLKEAEMLLTEFDPVFVAISKMKFPISGDYLRLCLFERIVHNLWQLQRPFEKLFYAKRWFRCSSTLDMSYGFDEHISPAIMLVVVLFQCGHYRDCFYAAKHTIRLCKCFAWDNFCTDFRFRASVKYLQTCEVVLGISSSLPYDCTPSVYFLSNKHENFVTAINDILDCVSVGKKNVRHLEFSPLLKFSGL